MSGGDSRFVWLRTGQEALAAMLSAVDQARQSVALEMYIYQDSPIGARFRAALVAAAHRGVRVRVLIDAFGSLELRHDYMEPVVAAGGDCRWFNPLGLRRLPHRDHRKLLIVDDEVAFIGGLNIATVYDGDGVTHGWHDLGMRIRGGELVLELSKAFHEMFGAASFRHRRLARFRRILHPQRVTTADGDLFLLSPGRGRNPARDALEEEIRCSRQVLLTTPYLLMPRQLRRALEVAAKGGAEVKLLLPGKSDVWLAQLAARGQYARLLASGVRIYEYQPVVLHVKRYLLDDVVYVGSANLDLRSLNINYELLVRIHDRALAAEGRADFEAELERSRQVTREQWRVRSWWNRIAERFAGALLVRVDLRFAMWRVSRLRQVGKRLPLGRGAGP
jgi:cardiolipin synthase